VFNMIEDLFSPGRKHTAEEQKRLEVSRVDVDGSDPGRGPIDLASGKVTIRLGATAPEDAEKPAPGAGAPGAAAEDAPAAGQDTDTGTDPAAGPKDRRAPGSTDRSFGPGES
jgi:hypothetical protein